MPPPPESDLPVRPDLDPHVRLAGRIRARVPYLLDSDEAAALIESFGITDRIAREDYGEPDVRSLAIRIEPLVYESDVPEIHEDEDLEDPAPYGYDNLFTSTLHRIAVSRAYHWTRGFGRRNIKGFFFAMPMLVSVIGLLVLKASLWSGLNFNVPTATAIGFGTLASLVVTGGYAQAIGRRGFFYLIQEEHTHARTVCYYFIGVGFEMSLAIGAAAFCFNFIAGFFSVRLALIAFIYYIFLSLMWLFLAVLYMLGQPLLFTPIIAVGILVVYSFQHYVGSLLIRQSVAMALAAALSFLGGYTAFGRKSGRNASLIWASLFSGAAMILTVLVFAGARQDLIAGICVVCLLAFFLIAFNFTRNEAREEAEIKTTELPRASLLWYKVGSYFTYGALYYSFLLVDRLIAWSTLDHPIIQGAFRFRTSYEVGMDWGLLLLICTLGLTESAIILFSDGIRAEEDRHSLEDPRGLSSVYKRFYVIRGILFILLSLIVSIFLWYSVTALAEHSRSVLLRAYLDPIARMVFLVSTPGYIFLSWSLFNNVVLFALSRPERVLPNISIALLIHILLSYALTRLFGHPFAAVGFTVGSLVLAVLSSITVLQVIGDLDYYYYSAYL